MAEEGSRQPVDGIATAGFEAPLKPQVRGGRDNVTVARTVGGSVVNPPVDTPEKADDDDTFEVEDAPGTPDVFEVAERAATAAATTTADAPKWPPCPNPRCVAPSVGRRPGAPPGEHHCLGMWPQLDPRGGRSMTPDQLAHGHPLLALAIVEAELHGRFHDRNALIEAAVTEEPGCVMHWLSSFLVTELAKHHEDRGAHEVKAVRRALLGYDTAAP
jgi:hypothetical protein